MLIKNKNKIIKLKINNVKKYKSVNRLILKGSEECG